MTRSHRVRLLAALATWGGMAAGGACSEPRNESPPPELLRPDAASAMDVVGTQPDAMATQDLKSEADALEVHPHEVATTAPPVYDAAPTEGRPRDRPQPNPAEACTPPQGGMCNTPGICQTLVWDFEADLASWQSPPGPGNAAVAGIRLAEGRAHGGVSAIEARLDVDRTLVPARDSAYLQRWLCGAINSWGKELTIDLKNRTLSAWIMLLPDPGAPAAQVTCRFGASAGTGETVALTPMQDPGPLPAAQWVELRGVLYEAASTNTNYFGISCRFQGTDHWTGTLLVDDIAVR